MSWNEFLDGSRIESGMRRARGFFRNNSLIELQKYTLGHILRSFFE